MDRKYSKDNLNVMLAVFSYSGLEEKTHESLMCEVAHCSHNNKAYQYARISGDALIARSRSKAIGRFLRSDCDVMVMIDHDIVWNAGEAWDLGKLAFEHNAIIGGMYCKRTFGQGWASRAKFDGDVAFGKPGLIESDAVATGFMAIPREVIQGMVDRLDVDGAYHQRVMDNCTPEESGLMRDLSIGRIVEGDHKYMDHDYYDAFRCIRLPNPYVEEAYQFLSEDYAFCKRAQACGYRTLISTKPLLGHIGSHVYRVSDGMDADDRSQLNG